MSFNIFDFARKSDITVGYVDPSLGYVTGVSICDANEYARKILVQHLFLKREMEYDI
jgi:hypothetical protein